MTAQPTCPLVLAMTGASGAPYAVRLLQVLCRAGRTVHLTISTSGAQVLREELGIQRGPESVRSGPVFGDLGSGISSTTTRTTSTPGSRRVRSGRRGWW